MTTNEMVLEFHKRFMVSKVETKFPKIPNFAIQVLRKALITEEYEEFLDAWEKKDLVEIADALGDLIYVIYGCAIAYGIPLDKVIEEIHRSNMTKIWPGGFVNYREDGKVLKPPSFEKPNIKSVLGI